MKAGGGSGGAMGWMGLGRARSSPSWPSLERAYRPVRLRVLIYPRCFLLANAWQVRLQWKCVSNWFFIMKILTFFLPRNSRIALLVLAMVLAGFTRSWAQPVIVSVVPADGASNVSPSAVFVFTFSEQMDTGLTSVQFSRASPLTPLPVSSVWSGANKVLTCTPTPAFPAGELIFWDVTGENLPGDPLEGDHFGYFRTSGAPLVFTNLTRAVGITSFDVKSSTGQSFTVEYSVTMLTNQWQTLVATNSATGLLRINHSATNKYLFYRARKNS